VVSKIAKRSITSKADVPTTVHRGQRDVEFVKLGNYHSSIHVDSYARVIYDIYYALYRPNFIKTKEVSFATFCS